jgi:hypothetical protein
MKASRCIWLISLVILLISCGSSDTEEGQENRMSEQENSLIHTLAASLDSNNLNDMEKTLVLTAWVYASISARGLTRENDFSCERGEFCMSEETLTLLDGSCGYRDVLMQDVLGMLRLPTRRISFYGVPIQIGHTATEVLIDGKWHFIDSTFGIFFSKPENPDEPISLAEARHLYPDINIMHAQVAGWQGAWNDMPELEDLLIKEVLYSPRSAGAVEYPGRPDRIVADIEQTYFYSDMYIIEEENDVFLLPVYLDLRDQSAGNFGTEDSSIEDLIDYSHTTSFGEIYHPLMFLFGDYQGINVGHKLVFLSDVEQRVSLTFTFVEPIDEEYRKYFVGQIEHATLDYTYENHQITFDWLANRLIVSFNIIPSATSIEINLGRAFGQSHYFHLDAIAWTGHPSSTMLSKAQGRNVATTAAAWPTVVQTARVFGAIRYSKARLTR